MPEKHIDLCARASDHTDRHTHFVVSKYKFDKTVTYTRFLGKMLLLYITLLYILKKVNRKIEYSTKTEFREEMQIKIVVVVYTCASVPNVMKTKYKMMHLSKRRSCSFCKDFRARHHVWDSFVRSWFSFNVWFFTSLERGVLNRKRLLCKRSKNRKSRIGFSI